LLRCPAAAPMTDESAPCAGRAIARELLCRRPALGGSSPRLAAARPIASDYPLGRGSCVARQVLPRGFRKFSMVAGGRSDAARLILAFSARALRVAAAGRGFTILVRQGGWRFLSRRLLIVTFHFRVRWMRCRLGRMANTCLDHLSGRQRDARAPCRIDPERFRRYFNCDHGVGGTTCALNCFSRSSR